MFEIADGVTLLLLRAEEGDSGFRRYGGRHHSLGGSNENKSIAFWFPSEIDDGVFNRIDDFNGHTFFFHAENLQIRG